MKDPAKLILFILLGVLGSVAHAAGPVRVSVISVAGRSVFLDQGQRVGIVAGLRLRLFPAGAAPIDGIITDASSNSSRAELFPGAGVPVIGTTGEVNVPETTPTTMPTTAPSPTTAPTHAPWARQDGSRTPDMPLLAPAFSRPASARAPTFHGRIFSSFDYSLDQSSGRDNQYYLGRIGTALTITNPFGQGGELAFTGEYDRRDSDVDFGSGTSDNDFILDQLSYTIGNEAYSPYRLEVGRFFSYYLPEIGLLDGIEAAMRFQNGLNLGGGVGAYPAAYTERREGDDLGFHLFVDYQSPGANNLAATLGYQKTWNKGNPDRDLLIGHASAWLTKSLWVYGAAKADIYSNSEAVKPSGIDLTDAWLMMRYTPKTDRGVSLSYSHFTWADVKRDEFLPPPVMELISDGQVDRIELSVWRDITKNLRPTARLRYFSDQRDDGFGGELDLDWTNIRKSPVDFYGAVFYDEGSFTKGMGFRTELRPHPGDRQFFIGYEFYRYTAADSILDSGYFTRHTVRGGVSWQVEKWYYSLSADHYFGDGEDGYRMSILVEYRF